MCRNIKPLFNFDPPATQEEIYDSSLQYVRKVSGFTRVSDVNQKVYKNAVEEIAKTTQRLLENLKTDSPQKNREEETRKRKERSKIRFRN